MSLVHSQGEGIFWNCPNSKPEAIKGNCEKETAYTFLRLSKSTVLRSNMNIYYPISDILCKVQWIKSKNTWIVWSHNVIRFSQSAVA